jgi:hypothetical protein
MENKISISDEELDKLAKWLKSDEGREKIRKSQETADEVCKIIDSMNDIDRETLTTPFGPVKRNNWQDEIKSTISGLSSFGKLLKKEKPQRCECTVKTNVELRQDGKWYCGKCGKLY